MKRILMIALISLLLPATVTPAGQTDKTGHYENFKVAIYIAVYHTRLLADQAVFERQFDRAMRQVKFDKVYLEVYRNKVFATDEEIEKVKQYFTGRGVEVAGGITPAAGGAGGQFGTFDYENAADREECKKVVELAAKHFDEVILDDFFFYTSKSDADIEAKGRKSWTQYRLQTMREVSRNLILKPARAVNPAVKITIKYPNWYEHFQGLGYDLEQQAQTFDYIYTGTETRDPYITDQLLQQYESYLIFRYFSNIRPGGGNRGGWVDTFSVRYVDRYAEQLWDTLFAKAPEITLFNWRPMSEDDPLLPGERDAWKNKNTSFNWNEMLASYQSSGPGDPGPGWGRAAGYSLEQVDKFLGKLGQPVGIWAYKPFHSSGEDFLHNYLGNIGIPIELTPQFPRHAQTVLLTESAKYDPEIVDRMKAQLKAGKNVIMTSGLLRALQERIKDIVEIEYTGRTVAISDFIDGYGAGSGTSLNDPKIETADILFPEIRFYTNDAWPIIRGVAGAKGFPVVLMNRYSKGVIYVLAVPENIADLYRFPQALITQIKRYLLGDYPVRLEAEALVNLFTYDNRTFIVQSFLDKATEVTVSILGENIRLKNSLTGKPLPAAPDDIPAPESSRPRDQGTARTGFKFTIQPHSYEVFEFE
jgi:hypothetical protein